MDTLDTKTMFAPKKGKQATKGQKQIYEGNMDTIKFYLIMAVATICLKLFLSLSTTLDLNLIMTIAAILAQSAAIYAMYHMAKPVVSGPSNTVVDGGIDLNLKGGFADYLKDLIITTAICSVLSILSNGWWLLWLWLPCFYVYKFWVSVIAPWIFQAAPEQPEMDEKKRQKKERKRARAAYR